MKRCPECHRTYTDATQAFCLYDGKPLVPVEASPAASPADPVSVAPSVPAVPSVPPLEALRPLSPVMAETQPVTPSLPPLPALPPPGYAPPLNNEYPPPTGYNAPSPPASSYPASASAPNASRTSLLPVGIIVALVVLLALFRQHQQNQPAPPGNVPVINIPGATPGQSGTPPEPSGNPAPKESTDAVAIANAVRQADDAEAQALRTVDPSGLSEWYTGAALQQELKNVESLKTLGRYAENHLDKQEFQNAEMSRDGQQAKVRVVETWTSTYYDSQTRQVAEQQAAHTVPQTVTLERNGDKWLVANIEQ